MALCTESARQQHKAVGGLLECKEKSEFGQSNDNFFRQAHRAAHAAADNLAVFDCGGSFDHAAGLVQAETMLAVALLQSQKHRNRHGTAAAAALPDRESVSHTYTTGTMFSPFRKRIP